MPTANPKRTALSKRPAGSPKPTGLATAKFVKVVAKAGGSTERFWVKVTGRNGSKLSGTVANKLELTSKHGYKYGARVSVMPSQVFATVKGNPKRKLMTELPPQPPGEDYSRFVRDYPASVFVKRLGHTLSDWGLKSTDVVRVLGSRSHRFVLVVGRWPAKSIGTLTEAELRSLTKANPKKPGVPGGSVTACIKRMRKRKAKRGSPRDPAALCAWIADQREPGWRSGARKSTKKRRNTMKMTTTPRRKTMPGRKLNQGYAITSKGLAATKKIALRKGMEVFFGASSSPSHIKIVKLEKDKIHYRVTGEKRTKVIERWIGEDLIARGTRTWLRSGYPKHFPDLAKKLRKVVSSNPAKKAAPARKSNPSPASHRRKAEAAEKAMDESNKRVGQAVKNKDWEEARRLACISAKHAAVASKEYGHAQNTRKAKYMANWAQRIEAHVGYGFKGSSRKNPAKKATPTRKSNPKRRVAKRNPRRLAALTKI